MGVSGGIAVAGLVSAYMASEGAKGAAGTQAAAGQQAIATQQQMLQSQQAIQAPYVSAGQQALQALLTGTQPGGQFTQQFKMDQALPQFTPFKAEGSEAVRFATEAATDAMRNQMAVGGQALSSNAISGAGQLAGDIASQYEQQAYNQWLASNQTQFQQALAGQQQAQSVYQMNLQNQLQPLQYLTGVGQAAASGQAANLGAAGSNIAGLQTGIGNAMAAGQIGAANAQAGAVGNISQYMMLQSLLGKK